MNDWLLIALMALVTFVPRYLPFALAGRVKLPAVLERGLDFVPVAVLTAIIAQTTLIRGGEFDLTIGNLHAIAAAAALDSFTANVAKALKKKDGKVTLVGFGTFMKVRRKARKGRNPQTGEVIKIKAANVVKFKPGKKLRDAV